MVTDGSSSWVRVRNHLDEYTPDGALGRTLLALVAGPSALLSLFLAIAFLNTPTIASLLVVPLAAVVGIGLGLLTALVLWPVYLSVIGRVDSAATYSGTRQTDAKASPAERVKSQYREGEMSEAELERRLESVLDGSSEEKSPRADSDGERTTERERNR